MFSALNQARGGSRHPSSSSKNTSKVTKTITIAKKVKKSNPGVAAKPVRSSHGKPVKQIGSKLRRTANVAKYHRAPESDSEDDNWERNIGKLSSGTPNPEGTPLSGLLISRNIYNGSKSILQDLQHIDAESFISEHINEYKPAIGDQILHYTIELPFAIEKYSLAVPKKDDDLDPISETETVMDLISQYFVPSKYSNTIKDLQMRDCITRRIRRALRDNNLEKFQLGIAEYNELLSKLRDTGELANKIQSMDHVPFTFICEILNQVYRRVVSPNSNGLRDYEAFSSNVYGELLPVFVRQLLIDTALKSDQVFVDLGSGVGNCVLQAALEIGCESWGCEMMETASSLASTQKDEFESRIKAYGLLHGPIHLINANFVDDEDVKSALRRADTVLVNNYAFSASLNDSLVNMFLDLKDGCKVISLKSFVPPGHTISEHNIESPVNILHVERKEFGSNCVSWTDAGGVYYISTIDRTRLSQYS